MNSALKLRLGSGPTTLMMFSSITSPSRLATACSTATRRSGVSVA